MMVGLSGLLVTPFFISGALCAGTATTAIRVKLISTTFVVSGAATILQTTFGLR